MHRPSSSSLAHHWLLDHRVVFLNHGSFGACPRVVLETQQRLRERLEAQPVAFFVRDLEALLEKARARLAAFVHADPHDLVFIPNATHGVNAVLQSLKLAPDDELLITDHAYPACRNAIDFVSDKTGARVVVAALPFPVASSNEVVEAVLDRVTARTRIALIDHVTSATALVLPIAEIVQALADRGVDTLVDGAHGPGMVDLSLTELGAAYYTGNCHKWMCAPKGAGFIVVRRDLQHLVHPLAISHGMRSPRTDKSRFQLEFDWQGTHDPTAYLAVPAAIDFIEGLLPGGIEQLRAHNRALALAARDTLVATLGCANPAPDDMLGAFATVPLPRDLSPWSTCALLDPLQDLLLARWGIEVPVFSWPSPPHRLIRVSAQAYTTIEQVEYLATALRELLDEFAGPKR